MSLHPLPVDWRSTFPVRWLLCRVFPIGSEVIWRWVHLMMWSRGCWSRLSMSKADISRKSTKLKNVHVSLEIASLSKTSIPSKPAALLQFDADRDATLMVRTIFQLYAQERRHSRWKYATPTWKMTKSNKFDSCWKWTKKWATDLGNPPPQAGQQSVDVVWRRSIHHS